MGGYIPIYKNVCIKGLGGFMRALQGFFEQKNNNFKGGFTLIELLVVVLIIGILSSIALPQYQKAVMKARAAEVDVILNTLIRSINLYLEGNGGFPEPGTMVFFTGTQSASVIDLSCGSSNSMSCFTKVGGFGAYCDSSSCNIVMDFYYNADGTTGNKWLSSSEVDIYATYTKSGGWSVGPIWGSKSNISQCSGATAAGKVIAPVLARHFPDSASYLCVTNP